MNIKKIIREEMDGWEWIKEIKPTINSVEDIKYFLNKPFKLYDTVTGEVDMNDDVVDGVYWLEEYTTSPTRYSVCWHSLIYAGEKQKQCVFYRSEEIVENFDESLKKKIWTWKFVD